MIPTPSSHSRSETGGNSVVIPLDSPHTYTSTKSTSYRYSCASIGMSRTPNTEKTSIQGRIVRISLRNYSTSGFSAIPSQIPPMLYDEERFPPHRNQKTLLRCKKQIYISWSPHRSRNRYLSMLVQFCTF